MNNILTKYNKVHNIDDSSGIEGKDFINVSKYSSSRLGKALFLGNGISISTIFGMIGSIRNAADYITTPDYPVKLLSRKNLTFDEINRIPKQKLNVPNFWSVMAYVICVRIKKDDEVMALFRGLPDDIVFTSYNIVNQTSLGISAKVNRFNMKMGMYLAIFKYIHKMIKNDTFTDNDIQNFIIGCKNDMTKKVFEDLSIKVDSSI